MPGVSCIVIFVFGDFTSQSSGSHVRMSEVIDWASQNSEKVVVYSYWEHPTVPWNAAARGKFGARFPGVELVLDHAPKVLGLVTKVRNLALMFVPSMARLILSKSVCGANPSLKPYLNDPACQFIVNFADGLTRLDGVPSGRAIVDTHDVKWVRYGKLRGLPFWGVKSLLRLRSETAALSTCRGILAISAFEAALFRSIVPNVKTYLISTLPKSGAAAIAKADKDYDLLFVGSEWAFNVTGLLGFLRSERERLGHMRLAIAGKVGSGEGVREAAAIWPNAEILGFVDDLDGLYARSKVVIAPVHGTGLNIKIVEALAHAKPVFASDAARTALPQGFDGCVFPIDSDQLEVLVGSEPARVAAEELALAYSVTLSNSGDAKVLLEDMSA